jgi:hypothetical protein
MPNKNIRVPGFRGALNDARILNSALNKYLIFRNGKAVGIIDPRSGAAVRGGQFVTQSVLDSIDNVIERVAGADLQFIIDDWVASIEYAEQQALVQAFGAVEVDARPYIRFIDQLNKSINEIYQQLDIELLATGRRLLNSNQRKTGRWWLAMEGYNPGGSGKRLTGMLFGSQNVVVGKTSKAGRARQFEWPDQTKLQKAKHWRRVEYGGKFEAAAGIFYPTYKILDKNRPNVSTRFYPAGKGLPKAAIMTGPAKNAVFVPRRESNVEGKFLLTITGETVVGKGGEKFFERVKEPFFGIDDEVFGDEQRATQEVTMTITT